ncbi:hypothetical protein [Spirochaeta isovalerica]|uniref:Uncharacterized protein n=1 Tax=Spirochaeta isovalerica TaxID=150 RepID=A0A841R6M2_9SPIO|nr:hypothetical protein [Spirochaeta isovalerica]MBB6479483.1 hypothetical protein [Spirochaeta isovalerica]
MPALYVLILIPLLFYIILPLIGAFRVRSVWRQFRLTMINASLFPICTYGEIIGDRKEGYFRFFGEIESIQSRKLLWVKNKNMTMTVKMEHCFVYLIPSEKKMNSQMPTKLSWNRVFSIAEGTAVYISGEVREEDGRLLFAGDRKNPLTVIIYDGEESSLLERSISCGRQKNEYWNFLTPWSIAIGGILSLVLLNMMIQANVPAEFLIGGILVAALPILPFLPPGLFFFFLYTAFWRRGRNCRADRDLIALPLRFEDRNIFAREYRHIRFGSGQPFMPVEPGYKVRGIHYPGKEKKTLWDHSLFGAEIQKESGSFIGRPLDPMKEFLLIEDEPRSLIMRSTAKAFLFEILAMTSILSALTINIWLIILIFQSL